MARYTVTVYVDVEMDDDCDKEVYFSRESKRAIEHSIIDTLKRHNPRGTHIDAECMDVALVTT